MKNFGQVFIQSASLALL